MKKRLTKENLLTIPNALSLFRLLLIPLILCAYRGAGSIPWTVGLICLSALSDVADGRIARRFNMVSDLGKILDPIADKLTQMALVLCLCRQNPRLYLLLALMAARELMLGLFGLTALQATDTVNSARWYGKLCTAMIYAAMLCLIVFPGVPDRAALALVLLCAAVVLLSAALYARYYVRFLRRETGAGSRRHIHTVIYRGTVICLWIAALLLTILRQLWWGLGALGAITLAALGLFLYRRRQRGREKTEE